MEGLNYNKLERTLESMMERVFEKKMTQCIVTIREEVFAELGVSEYMVLSKSYRVYSENFIKKWRRSGKLKNVGTVKRVKFKISDLEKISEQDECYQTYLAKKLRNKEKKLRVAEKKAKKEEKLIH